MNVHPAEAVGMSSERLQRVSAYLDRAVSNDQLPGIIAVAARRGSIVHHSMHGKMDIEAGRAMEADAIFRIYSMTKPVVSLALMMLHDEGRVMLHDPVSRFIPGFGKTMVYSHISDGRLRLAEQDPPMSVFHLLTHTAGLSYGGEPYHPVDEQFRLASERHDFFQRHVPLADMVGRIAELPLKYQPGSDWEYSVATDVLGYLVQVIADMPLAEFLQERIFAPLGMVDTGFHVPPAQAGRLCAIYGSDASGVPLLIDHADVANGDVRLPTVCPSGGGGLVSTTADYLRFAAMLLNGGELDGARLVSPLTIKRMATNAVPRAWLPLRIGIERYGYGFGLGFRVMLDYGRANGYSSPGEFGWAGAASTHFVIDPVEELVTLMMTQMWSEEPHRPRSIFPNLVYQAIEESYAN
ncbi:MAG: beta-lactamase family protein [Chloroflexi bacterium]|nr:beta-lactamase family protein [Chloroflexota bacterium]